jgi:hypothetical protein
MIMGKNSDSGKRSEELPIPLQQALSQSKQLFDLFLEARRRPSIDHIPRAYQERFDRIVVEDRIDDAIVPSLLQLLRVVLQGPTLLDEFTRTTPIARPVLM